MLSIDAWLDEKPYKEVFDRAIHEKVSPQFAHMRVAAQILKVLLDWSDPRGAAGPELRVYLKPGTTLVPDVAFIFAERLASLSPEQLQRPPFAPDLVVEVRSPDDRERNIARKTALYLAHGAIAVLNVDPRDRTIQVCVADGVHVLSQGDVFEHPAFPELSIPIATVFAPLDRTF